jgi:hypothetical protein
MNKKIIVALLIVIALTITIIFLRSTNTIASAQTRPSSHWSTFNKQATPCACHLFSLNALRREGLNQIFEDTGSVILAGNNRVMAEIVCLPGNRQIRLSAFSSDSQTAELTRNRVRESIVRGQIIDDCP